MHRSGGTFVVGRGPRAHGLAGAWLFGTLGLTAGSFGGALLPTAVAGASNPAALNCGTLVISGTDNNSYRFSEFTTGDATRGATTGSGGSVAYGGNLTATNFTVAQNVLVWPRTLTAVVGGDETGQFDLRRGSAVVAGAAGGPTYLNGWPWATATVGQGASSLPFTFSSIGAALATCSDNYGANGTATTGTITELNPGYPTLGLYGTGRVNVFNVSTDQLVGARHIDFSVPRTSTTLVEVTPSADFTGSLNLAALDGNIDYGCPWAPPTASNMFWHHGNCGFQPLGNENRFRLDVERDNTVWNFSPSLFPQSDTLTVAGWQGTIVAPNQAVTLSNGVVDGSVFAASIVGNGQTDFDPFGGSVPCLLDPLPVLPEGLPVEMGALAVLGFAGLLLHRTHRRRRARAIVALA